MTDKKAIECANALSAFCDTQIECQNCVFRKYGADRWYCYLDLIHKDDYDKTEIQSNYEAKRKNHGFI